MAATKKLFLLDGHALVYRAHFAFITRPLINSKGINTSAIGGFVRALWDIIQTQKPSHIAVSFDLPSPTFRHTYFPAYKANRDAQPEDITIAMPYIKRIIEGMNIPIVTHESFEADDVIGTLAKQAEKEGFNVFMVTPDKDYAQLVSENIFLYKPARQGNDIEILGVKEILENWQIKRIDQVIDVLGLQGDSVDNIPGVPGIGPKTAVTLLEKYDNIENIIAHAHELKGKQQEQITLFADQARLSKQLATIALDVPIQFDAQKYLLEPVNKDVLQPIFRELEFRSIATLILGNIDDDVAQKNIEKQVVDRDLFGNPIIKKEEKLKPHHTSVNENDKESKKIAPTTHYKTIADVSHQYFLVDSDAAISDLINTLSQLTEFCFDTESTGIDANIAELVGISFSYKNHTGYYVPISSNQDAAKKRIQLFKPILENPKILKIGQNIKYDALLLKWYDIELQGEYFDTMIAHYLLEPDLRHNMDYLSESYLNYQPVAIDSLIGKKGVKQLSMRDVSVDLVKDYAAEDADVTFQLKTFLEKELTHHNLVNLYKTVEEPLIPVLTDLEYAGIKIDADFLKNYSNELADYITTYEEKIFEHCGVRFNLSSPKQVGEVLFDKLKIPYPWRKTSTGQYSTDEEKLNDLALDNPIVAEILNYRSVSKLKSTYSDALPKMINPKTGRVHSSFNQALASTGRLSSNNPNLQNIPIRTPEGRRIREAFVPRDKNHILLSADYSQIELRLIAEISGDEAMLEAFQLNQDIHRATAAKVYDVAYESVTSDQRRNAKTVNFSIIYGAGAQNLSKQLSIKRTEAKDLIEQYFRQYKGLKNYMEKTVETARTVGYVTTLMGRKRYLRDIDSRNNLMRTNAERMAINTPIQGTAADMIKLAMIKIYSNLKAENLQSKMILQVHDELVFDVQKDELDRIKPIIENGMKHAIPNLKVPIEVGIGVGENWLEAH
ncbi:MAG: DNA polymerase I [Saprospiraceae bacterium]|nr:DNA polymerase I [Saprospiraceae bacterium]